MVNASMPPHVCLILFVDDFLKQSNGMLTMYTLKNPSFPEWVFSLTFWIHFIQNSNDWIIKEKVLLVFRHTM